MSASLRFSYYVRHLSKWQFAVKINRTFVTSSQNVSADAAAAAQIPQRKIELKNPIGVEKLQNLFDAETKNGDVVPVFKRALLYGNKIAIKDTTGDYSYRQILEAARKLSVELSEHSYSEYFIFCNTFCLAKMVFTTKMIFLGEANETKVALLCSNSALYSVIQWACWISGQIGELNSFQIKAYLYNLLISVLIYLNSGAIKFTSSA